ncbi:sulfatase [Paenibacillus sp. HB172176]|uniref:sulfatase family protein n=1 Tax=Paenibacillus sp. HB172176 TaxID=2493690 RepID=UPI0014393EDD|nr:sulfatase [Paenibacillus sp. HB172176]
MEERRKPNIVYVFADQWRRQAVGIRNEDPVMTPNMDRFASESMVFEQAVSCTPLCSPHRAALLTGRYALSTGVYTNCKTGLDMRLSPEETAIGHVLSGAGYRTGYIGKWHLDLPEQNREEHPLSGAREWDAYTPPGPGRFGFDYWYSYGAYDQHLKPHYWENSPEMVKVDQWSAEHETDKALAFLREHGGKQEPFALFVSWNPPHSPFELVPEAYRDSYADKKLSPHSHRANVIVQDPFLIHTGEEVDGGAERLDQASRDYFAAVTGIDEQFGRIMDELRELNLLEQTIVVLTSDHGELLGSHGMMAKHSWHEESIGVPFMIGWKGAIKPGTTDVVLNTVDIMPTLLELAELPLPDSIEGSSVADFLKKGGSSEEAELASRAAYISAFPGRMEAIESFRAAGLEHLHYGWRGVRTSRYTYVVDKGYFAGSETRRLLYDLADDPFQMKPVSLKSATEHPVAQLLEVRLREFLDETRDSFSL